jgi:hypothetical protein
MQADGSFLSSFSKMKRQKTFPYNPEKVKVCLEKTSSVVAMAGFQLCPVHEHPTVGGNDNRGIWERAKSP